MMAQQTVSDHGDALVVYQALEEERKRLQGERYLCKEDLVQATLSAERYSIERCEKLRPEYHTLTAELDRVTREEASLVANHPRLRARLEQEFSVEGPEAEGGNSWPQPESLPSGLLPVPAMPAKLIPEPFREWLVDIADRMQCSLEFPTVAALVSFAGLVGRSVGIIPKRQDVWIVVPNLWGAVVGRPGVMKSPALTEGMRHLQCLAAEAAQQYEEALKTSSAARLIAVARKDSVQREIREALKKKTSSVDLNDVTTRLAEYEKEAQEPVQKRHIVNDSTVEKLGELLNQNPNGLLLFRDELTGWLRTLDREGHENDRSFYLEAWNGDGAYTYDRIGRGTLRIKAACVSVLGGIQPGPLGDYLRAALRGGSGDDGLMSRFQLAVYPDDTREWRNVDSKPDVKAKEKAYTVFKNLSLVTGGEEPRYLRVADDAQEQFDEWRIDLEHKLRSRENHPVIEAHLAKYRSLMPSLALLFHLIDIGGSPDLRPVSSEATKMAAGWCDFLEAHARRIYQSVTQQATLAAHQLGDRIKAGTIKSPFTLRAIYRNAWSGLSDPDAVRSAVEILEDHYWIRPEKLTIPGRMKLQYVLNPLLRGGKESP